jgi:hypothetical protein
MGSNIDGYRRSGSMLPVGGDSEAPGQRRREVAQDIGVQVRRDDGVQRRRPHHHARRHRVDEFLVPLDVGKLARDLMGDLVPHHHGMPLRVALGHDGEVPAGTRPRQFEGVAQDALDAGARHHRNVGRDLDRMPLVHPAADTRVLALRVLADDHPVQVIRLATLERSVDAREDSRRADVRVLIEALADLEPQSPQRDVVGNVGIASRAEEDCILLAERIETVGGHHLAMLAIVVGTPIEVLEFEPEPEARGGNGFHDTLARWNDFLADAVARNRRDSVGLHHVSCG